MAEGINVRFSGALLQFIEERTGPGGLYASSSEYIRDLVRHDFEREESVRWDRLVTELKAGLEADPSEFGQLDPAAILELARARHRPNDG